jgi:very-short-patch-repair endonuclease
MARRPGSDHPPRLTEADLPRLTLWRDHLATPRADLRSGDVIAVRRGAFVQAADLPTERRARERALLLAHLAAVSRQLGDAVALSHTSAAVLWGLPRVGDGRPHVTQRTRPSADVADDVTRHVHPLRGAEQDVVAGLRVTSLLRTTMDCATWCRGSDGLAVMDAALRAGTAPEDLERALGPLVGRRGVRQARELVRLADDGAESAGESFARAAVLAVGLPPPRTQVEIQTAEGRVWGDLGWDAWRLLVEYDGAAKYGTDGVDSLLREKRREDLVRERGWHVVRMTADDLREPHRLLGRLGPWVPDRVLRALTPRPFLQNHPQRRSARSHR